MLDSMCRSRRQPSASSMTAGHPFEEVHPKADDPPSQRTLRLALVALSNSGRLLESVGLGGPFDPGLATVLRSEAGRAAEPPCPENGVRAHSRCDLSCVTRLRAFAKILASRPDGKSDHEPSTCLDEVARHPPNRHLGQQARSTKAPSDNQRNLRWPHRR